MVSVDIDRELYSDIKKLVKKNKFYYPSVKFFVQKAVFKEIQSDKNDFGSDFDSFYSKIREILKRDPELRSRIDKIYNLEVSNIKNKNRREIFL